MQQTPMIIQKEEQGWIKPKTTKLRRPKKFQFEGLK